MALEIVWTLKAKNELIDILQYWVERNKSKAFSIKLFMLIEEELNLMKDYPELGKKTDIENVYVKVINQYFLYYEINATTLYVLTLRHTSKNPKTLKVR